MLEISSQEMQLKVEVNGLVNWKRSWRTPYAFFKISRVICIRAWWYRRHSSTFEPFRTEQTGVENVTGASLCKYIHLRLILANQLYARWYNVNVDLLGKFDCRLSFTRCCDVSLIAGCLIYNNTKYCEKISHMDEII